MTRAESAPAVHGEQYVLISGVGLAVKVTDPSSPLDLEAVRRDMSTEFGHLGQLEVTTNSESIKQLIAGFWFVGALVPVFLAVQFAKSDSIFGLSLVAFVCLSESMVLLTVCLLVYFWRTRMAQSGVEPQEEMPGSSSLAKVVR